MPRPRYAYVWILGANGKIRDYAKGIQAAVSLLRNNKADLIHVTSDKDKCTVCSTIVIDYVLMIPDKTPTEQRATFDHLVHSMRPQFDTVVKVPAVGAANYFYADHYFKLLMFGLFDNGPLQTRHFYHRVLSRLCTASVLVAPFRPQSHSRPAFAGAKPRVAACYS